MVSYFYRAGYDASKYDVSESLLHAQVAIIADKYDCASLYKLAQISFASTVNAVESGDWVTIAGLIYHYTIESPAHEELRWLVISSVANRPNVLESILGMESTVELLRSNADLATDILLNGMHKRKTEDNTRYIFFCDGCRYAHAGSRDCSRLVPDSRYEDGMGVCPRCGTGSGKISKRHVHKVGLVKTSPCVCDGIETEL